MERKLKLITFIMLIIGLIVIPYSSKAALQSNGQAGTTKSLDQWVLQIRQMESLGGGLGLSEIVNATGLQATSESNNIDVHMEKNTEYGALIILSASNYGKPDKINNGETTTGNSTGVKMNINKEWVSAGPTVERYPVSTWNKAAKRYKNIYNNSNVNSKRGDALINWHGSSSAKWFNQSFVRECGMLRSYGGSIFSYNCDGYTADKYDGRLDPHPDRTWYSRAVIVMGEGF